MQVNGYLASELWRGNRISLLHRQAGLGLCSVVDDGAVFIDKWGTGKSFREQGMERESKWMRWMSMFFGIAFVVLLIYSLVDKRMHNGNRNFRCASFLLVEKINIVSMNSVSVFYINKHTFSRHKTMMIAGIEQIIMPRNASLGRFHISNRLEMLELQYSDSLRMQHTFLVLLAI